MRAGSLVVNNIFVPSRIGIDTEVIPKRIHRNSRHASSSGEALSYQPGYRLDLTTLNEDHHNAAKSDLELAGSACLLLEDQTASNRYLYLEGPDQNMYWTELIICRRLPRMKVNE